MASGGADADDEEEGGGEGRASADDAAEREHAATSDEAVVEDKPADAPPEPRGAALTRLFALARRGIALASERGAAVLAAFDRTAGKLWFRSAVAVLILIVHLL